MRKKDSNRAFQWVHSERVLNYPRRVLDFIIKTLSDASKNLAPGALVQLGFTAHERE